MQTKTLRSAVATGMSRWSARKLTDRPGAEELPASAGVMCDDLERLGYRDEDCERVLAAMDRIALDSPRWPHLRQVIDAVQPDQRALPARDDYGPIPGKYQRLLADNRAARPDLEPRPGESAQDRCLRVARTLAGSAGSPRNRQSTSPSRHNGPVAATQRLADGVAAMRTSQHGAKGAAPRTGETGASTVTLLRRPWHGPEPAA